MLSVLGIDPQINYDEMIRELNKTFAEYDELGRKYSNVMNTVMKHGFTYRGKFGKLSNIEVEEALAQRFAFKMLPNKKFLSSVEIENVIKTMLGSTIISILF